MFMFANLKFLKVTIISLFVLSLIALNLLVVPTTQAASKKRCSCTGDITIKNPSTQATKISSYYQCSLKKTSPTANPSCLNAKIALWSPDDKKDCSKVTATELTNTIKLKYSDVVGFSLNKCLDATGHTSPSSKPTPTPPTPTTPAPKSKYCQEKEGIEYCNLENPLKDTSFNANVLLGNVIRAALGIVGALSLFAFVHGGVTWLRSFGNPEKINKGMHSMLWAVLGLLVVFLSYGIAKWILGLLVSGKAWPG